MSTNRRQLQNDPYLQMSARTGSENRKPGLQDHRNAVFVQKMYACFQARCANNRANGHTGSRDMFKPLRVEFSEGKEAKRKEENGANMEENVYSWDRLANKSGRKRGLGGGELDLGSGDEAPLRESGMERLNSVHGARPHSVKVAVSLFSSRRAVGGAFEHVALTVPGGAHNRYSVLGIAKHSLIHVRTLSTVSDA